MKNGVGSPSLSSLISNGRIGVVSNGLAGEEENTYREIPDGGMLYGEYLMLDDLLRCQKPVTRKGGPPNVAHDEHLFIITHQAYELWFKQIIYELDSVRSLLQRRDAAAGCSSESNNLLVTSRLSRITLIWKVCANEAAMS